jgi:SPP1 family phage portal protein
MILSDQLSSFMLSFEENPIRAKKNVEGLQDHLNLYFDGKFWSEIDELITGTYNKGFEYIHGYKGKKNRMVFECADSMGVVEVRAKDTDDGCEYIIYWYVDRIAKGRKRIKRIQVWSEKEIYYFVQDGDSGKIERDSSEEINPRPHVIYTDEATGEKLGSSLGYIPFWRMDNNKKQFSGLKPIKGMIDDYDLHACSLSNNLKDFDTPLFAVKGFEGDDLSELHQNLKTKKIVGVGEGGDVEVRTVEIPYQARKEMLIIDKEGIFMFGMGFDPTQVGDGNITNVVILSRSALLELKANKLQDRLEGLLDQIVEVVLAEINEQNETDYQLTDIEYKFTRSMMTNESENISNEKIKAETKQVVINTILNVAERIGEEKAVQLICEELDIDFEEIKDELEKRKEEQNLADAKKTLEGDVIDEEDDDEIVE